MERAKVYFSENITAEAIIELYNAVGKSLEGRVAVKLHSGEVGNQNFIRPYMFKDIIEKVSGTIVECNTAYNGERSTTEKHLRTMDLHGWSGIAPVDIMDSEGDITLEIENGKIIKKNFVGGHLENYDSMLVLSHFKGHPMGGFGGALKNISIGIASAYGKAYIHGSGDPKKVWTGNHDTFLESMADASKSIVDFFSGRMVFISVMANMSVDCDCCAVAEDPAIADIGILASTDPVALDKACLDLVYASKDPGRDHLIERIESRNGILTVNAAEALGVGTTEYELVRL